MGKLLQGRSLKNVGGAVSLRIQREKTERNRREISRHQEEAAMAEQERQERALMATALEGKLTPGQVQFAVGLKLPG